MADDEDKDSKTEEATEKKIQDALDKGNVPFSKELGVFNGLIGLLIIFTLLMSDSVVRLSGVLQSFIDKPADWSLENGTDAVVIFSGLTSEIGVFLIPFVLILVVAGLGGAFIQNPPSMVLKRITPEASRISLSKGWGRLFGAQGFVEFAKSIFKLLSVTVVCAIIFQYSHADVVNAMFVEPGGVPGLAQELVVTVFSGVAIATAIMVVADIVWSRVSWQQKLRMTKQEVKDEHKQVDGDPIVKARMKSLARDRSRKRMIAAVPLATLVIANPTHFSIALRYEREENEVPVVVAKGKDIIALKIRQAAAEHGIPVIEDKVLARSLYDVVEVDSFIPPAFYKAVAELIYFISSRPNTGRRPTGN